MINERLCFYCDTFDGDFWIDKDPERPGPLVSAGGSGHAFKFSPLIGASPRTCWRASPTPKSTVSNGAHAASCTPKKSALHKKALENETAAPAAVFFLHQFVQNLTPFSYSLLRPEIFL
jgi:hypothetical protein